MSGPAIRQSRSAVAIRLEDFSGLVVALQRDIWGWRQDLEVRAFLQCFVVAAHTGGPSTSAHTMERFLVGFTTGTCGVAKRRAISALPHSDRRSCQLRGPRRRTPCSSFFQRDEALSRYLRLIEWTFRSVWNCRNAHFNLNRLGANMPPLPCRICTDGVTTSPFASRSCHRSARRRVVLSSIRRGSPPL